MKSCYIVLFAFLLMNTSAYADSISSKRLEKSVGNGFFVTSSDGQKFCTHNDTDLAFSESKKSLGLDIINKKTGEMAFYFLSDLTISTKLKGTIFENSQVSSKFPKYILINSSTYYFNSTSPNAEMEVDEGFMFKRIYDVNKNSSTLYCSKK